MYKPNTEAGHKVVRFGLKLVLLYDQIYNNLTSCIAIIKTVLRENFLSHKSNKSSKLGPNNSNTRALYFPHGPK